MGSSGRDLANREVFDYFRGGSIVWNHKLSNVIVHHCTSIGCANKVGCCEAEVSHAEFALFLSKIDEFLDTETPGMQFGPSDVYDATKTNWGNLGKGAPGSRSEDNARTANAGSWGKFRTKRKRERKKRGGKKCKHGK